MNRLIPPVERANALVYEILPSKGPEAYKTFVKCLQEETEHLGHQELAKKLTFPGKCKLYSQLLQLQLYHACMCRTQILENRDHIVTFHIIYICKYFRPSEL